MVFCTLCDAPLPTDTIAITAATPMITPSIVSAERSLLTARELARAMVHAIGQADLFEGAEGPRATVVAIAPVDQRKLHVLDGVEARQQVEGLEHEADVLVADRRELVVGELSHVLPGEHVRAGIGYVEATEDVHERRLARARGTHDRDELARSDVEIDAPERVHRDLSTDRVGLCDAAELDDALDHRPMNTGPPPGPPPPTRCVAVARVCGRTTKSPSETPETTSVTVSFAIPNVTSASTASRSEEHTSELQ